MSNAQKSISLTDEKPIIVFDLINVLFKESYIGFAQRIGYGTLTSYALTHWKNPGHRCLDMLHAISDHDTQKPHLIITLNDKTMPRCIVELYEGKQTCEQAKQEIQESIKRLEKEQFFSSSKEKNLMESIMNLMLDTQTITHITEPIKPMIALIQKLKQNGYALYLCANIPREFYEALQKKYPQILSDFNGIITSSSAQVAKPNKALFEKLITTYQVNPKQCILIEHSTDNVKSAESLGCRGIVYDKHSGLINYLKRHGVVV